MNDIDNLEDIIPGISPELSKRFREFFELVAKYNNTMNLISKSTISQAATKHFLDSFTGMSMVADHFVEGQPIFDFGSGNGFPGIVGAMMYPERKFLLVEKDQRKSEFLRIAKDKLNLENIEIHEGLVSDLQNEVCHNIISRAMAPLPKFLLEARKVTAVGGKAFLFKGDHWSTEFSTIPAPVFDYWDIQPMSSYMLSKNYGDRFIIRCDRV